MPPPVVQPQAGRIAADAAVGFSASSASWAWLSTANEILTMVATLAATIAAIFAIRYHHLARKKLLDEEHHDE